MALPQDWQSYLSPDMLLTWGIKIAAAIGILFVGWLIAGMVSRAVSKGLVRGKVDAALAGFLGGIVRYFVIFAAIIAGAGQLGIDTTSLTAIFASAGLAVGLALQGSLGNFAAGVMILFFRPFTLGDVVTIGGVTGGVLDISLFATRLGLPDGTQVIIANSSVTGGEIRNHVVAGRRRATIEVGVDYGSDLNTVREALVRAVTNVETLLVTPDNPGYGVAFVSFGASSLDWNVHAWFKPEDWLAGQEKVKVNVYNELNKAGIGIPFPQIDVHMPKAEA